MAKSTGLGMGLLIGGYDLANDVGSFGRISGGNSPLDTTGVDKSANERIGGKRDGGYEYTAFFNPSADRAHARLSTLPTADQASMGWIGSAIGDPVFSTVAKQLDYPGTRADDGAFTFEVTAESNGFGLEWGQLLTAALRTDTGATNGTSLDTTASVAQGAQAYLQVTAFSGTDVTIKVQDSADNAAFADVTGLTFTAVTAARTTERVATAAGATIRRYLRVATTTSGGFSSVTFAVAVVKNQTATVF